MPRTLHRVLCLSVLVGACGIAAAGPVGDLARTLGATPEVLTASGLTASTVQVVLTQLAQAEDARSAHASAIAAVESAVQSLATVNAQVAASPGDQALAEQAAAARRTLTEARAAVASTAATLRAAAFTGISPESIEIINAAMQAPNRRVPSELLVVERTPQEWKIIESALAASKRAGPSASQPAVLVAAASDSRVVQAKQWLDARLTAIEAVFEQF